ncbi:hypothetical protein [Stutzerimonas nitrititolerans]
MNYTLKAAGRIGTELGVVKAEVERLRGEIARVVREFDECDSFNSEGRAVELMEELRAALSQQAEPNESELEALGLGYPFSKEDAVKLWYKGFRTEPIALLEVWEAIGHDVGIDPSKHELMDSLRNMEAICRSHGYDFPSPSEPAPAQDEREAPEVVATAILGGLFHGGSGPELGEIDIEVCTPALEAIQCETVNGSDDVFLPLMTVAQHERIVASLARPAQTEQQPVAYQFDGSVLRSETGEWLCEFAGYKQSFIDSLLAAPIAQTAPQPSEESLVQNAKALLALDERGALAPHGIGGLAREVIEKLIAHIERTTPQPEQSALSGKCWIEVIGGREGPSIYIGDGEIAHRLAGNKPWGGGRTLHSFKVDVAELVREASALAIQGSSKP